MSLLMEKELFNIAHRQPPPPAYEYSLGSTHSLPSFSLAKDSHGSLFQSPPPPYSFFPVMISYSSKPESPAYLPPQGDSSNALAGSTASRKGSMYQLADFKDLTYQGIIEYSLYS